MGSVLEQSIPSVLSLSQLSYWKDSGQFVDIQGWQLFVQDSSNNYTYQPDERPVILCIHGFPTSSFDWLPVWEPLSTRYRLIASDLLGFGFSDKPQKHTYTIFEQADLITGLLSRLGVSKVHILAHDYGTIVAQELIARHEAARADNVLSILSVTFLNGAIFPEMHRPRLIQKLLLGPAGALVSYLLNERSFRKSFSAIFGRNTQPSAEELKSFWTLITYNQGQRISHLLINYIRERKQHRERWVGAMQATRIPLALINGLDDPVSGAHLVARVRRDLPQMQVFELAGIGHYPQVEAPAQTAQYLLSFLASLH